MIEPLIRLDHMAMGESNINNTIDDNVVIDPSSKLVHSNYIGRFKLNNLKYEPYIMDYMNLRYLDSRISFIRPGINEVCSFSNFKRFIYSQDVTSDTFSLWLPMDFKDKLIKVSTSKSDRSYKNYDISILGILALLTRCHYNDMVFKDFIENKYLRYNYEYSDTYGLWILDEKHRDNLGITKEFIIHLIDLNYNLGIKYYNNVIPYTFSWRYNDG